MHCKESFNQPLIIHLDIELNLLNILCVIDSNLLSVHNLDIELNLNLLILCVIDNSNLLRVHLNSELFLNKK